MCCYGFFDNPHLFFKLHNRTVIDGVPDALGVSLPDLPHRRDLPTLGLGKKRSEEFLLFFECQVVPSPPSLTSRFNRCDAEAIVAGDHRMNGRFGYATVPSNLFSGSWLVKARCRQSASAAAGRRGDQSSSGFLPLQEADGRLHGSLVPFLLFLSCARGPKDANPIRDQHRDADLFHKPRGRGFTLHSAKPSRAAGHRRSLVAVRWRA